MLPDRSPTRGDVTRLMSRPWTTPRVAVLVAGAIGTLVWIGALVQWWRIPQAHRDGLELIAPVVATAFFVLLVLPVLVLGLLGRWLVAAAIPGAIVLVLTSDALFPWLPWDWLPPPPSWL
jgi:hypothetical protein